MRRGFFSVLLAAAIAACGNLDGEEGPPGDVGGIGEPGLQGPPGAPGNRLVWRDAAGEIVPQVFATDLMYQSVPQAMFEDEQGHVWGVNPMTASPAVGRINAFTFHYSGAGCTGDAYSSAIAVPSPGVVFTTADPSDFRVFSSIGLLLDQPYQSRRSGGGGSCIAGAGVIDVAVSVAESEAAPTVSVPDFPPAPWIPEWTQ